MKNLYVRRAVIVATIWFWYPLYVIGSFVGMPIDMGEINEQIGDAWRKQ